MKPMGLTSTPFLSFNDIKTDGIDLYEDAWGFYPQFGDVIRLLKQVNPVPGRKLTSRLIQKIRKHE
jgi:hypothetical protein